LKLYSNGAYQTSDSSLATYHITEGFRLTWIDYSGPRFIYVFDGETHEENDPAVLKENENKYIAGQATVDPATFSRVNRKLMRIIHKKLQWWDE